ncbi:Peroxin 13, N-terminal region-domain-containing protein [Lipomyces doorenjongii]|uniref:Peroxin 13, N-terminal region-domain-containing protein n=1 Tax=Lipomyces doorenjongii TaxID=383834 RepID=UPI0034CE2015
MSSIQRPKPWEERGGGGAQSNPESANIGSQAQGAVPTTSASTSPVAAGISPSSAPSRPAPLPSSSTQIQAPANTSAYSSSYNYAGRPYANAYNPYSFSSPYTSAYSPYSSPYGSPYSRLYGAAGPSIPGAAGSLESSTTAAFQMLEAVVGAIGGFAQMLESTYMATHSSFFAMVGVAEQVAALRQSIIGSASLGMLAIWRVFVRIWRRLTGRQAPQQQNRLNMREFEKFKREGSPTGVPGNGSQRISVWPLLVFLGAVFGGPYLMSKLIKAISASRQEDEMRLSGYDSQVLGAGNSGMPIADGVVAGAAATGNDLIIDPSKLEFCRATYDFVPENEAIELAFKKGEVIAILSKDTVTGAEDGEPTWWRGRLRDGRIGFFPSNYVEVIKRRTGKAE